MAVYRNSPEGVQRLARRSLMRVRMILGSTLIVVYGCMIIREPSDWLATLLSLLIVGPLMFWAQSRSVGRLKNVIASTEVEIDEATLTCRNSVSATTIPRHEVTELRRVSDGVVVGSRDSRRCITIGSDLEGFDELIRQLESWTPPGTRPARSTVPGSLVFAGSVGAALALAAGVMLVETPAIAIPCCIAEAGLLAFGLVWTWRNPANARWHKWVSASMLLGVFGLLKPAYTLASGN